MFRKPIEFPIFCRQLLLPACILLAQNMAAGAGNEAPEQNGKSPDAQANMSRTAELGLKIDYVNDVGYALQRIRQQAINIYIEALRKPDSPEVSAALPSLTKVPAELPKDLNNLLPFRRPWLVYFVTTLEPLVHLLKEDVKEIESGAARIDIAPDTRKAIDPLIKEWSIGVGKLDEHLSATAALIEDADKNNVKIAGVASDLDMEVSELERIRDRCFRIIDEMEKKSKKSAEKTN